MDTAMKMVSARYSFRDTHFGSVQLAGSGAGFDHSLIATQQTSRNDPASTKSR